jgi:hypothetical protein
MQIGDRLSAAFATLIHNKRKVFLSSFGALRMIVDIFLPSELGA